MSSFCKIRFPNKFTKENIQELNSLFINLSDHSSIRCYTLDEVSFEFVNQSLGFEYDIYYFTKCKDNIYYRLVSNNNDAHFSASAIGREFIYACNTCAAEVGHLSKAYISVINDRWTLCFICYKQHEKILTNMDNIEQNIELDKYLMSYFEITSPN